MKSALLLSGGLDSIAMAYLKRPSVAITVDYGQKAAGAEVEVAAFISKKLRIRHEVVRADCSAVGLGCMSERGTCGKDVRAPTPEWWPFRNQLVVTLAAGRAVVLGIKRIIIGSVSTDKRHRDGTPDFVTQMSDLLKLQEGGMTLVAPAIQMTTLDLVAKSRIPLSLLAWAHSCHTGNYACGVCPGCIKNREIWDQIASSGGNR